MLFLQHWILCAVVLLGSIMCVTAGGGCAQPSDCNNRGTCVAENCNCDAGFYGSTCQDVCNSNTDCNGGSCTAGANGKVCSCPVTKYGQQCENDQVCASNTDCQNGGTCNQAAEAHVCDCAPGYSGSTCRDACNTNADCNGGTCSAQSPRKCSSQSDSTNQRLSKQLLSLFIISLMFCVPVAL